MCEPLHGQNRCRRAASSWHLFFFHRHVRCHHTSTKVYCDVKRGMCGCMHVFEFGTGPSYRSHTWLCIILCASVCVWERNQYMILFILICVCVCPHVLTMHLCVNLHLRVTFFFFFSYSNCFLLSVVSRALAGVLS